MTSIIQSLQIPCSVAASQLLISFTPGQSHDNRSAEIKSISHCRQHSSGLAAQCSLAQEGIRLRPLLGTSSKVLLCVLDWVEAVAHGRCARAVLSQTRSDSPCSIRAGWGCSSPGSPCACLTSLQAQFLCAFPESSWTASNSSFTVLPSWSFSGSKRCVQCLWHKLCQHSSREHILSMGHSYPTVFHWDPNKCWWICVDCSISRREDTNTWHCNGIMKIF